MMKHWRAAGATLTIAASAQALEFNVTFNDPGAIYSPFYEAIESNVLGAGALWAAHLDSSVSLEVEIRFADIPTANGTSVTSVFSREENGLDIFEQSAAFEVRTGVDPNGSSPDIRFTIGTSYMADTLWFDADPLSRIETVPADRTDAVSVFMHEFGHALAFNGYRNYSTGALPSNYASPFDLHIQMVSGVPYYNGPSAISLYGGPIPLTVDNLYHVGNLEPPIGVDLVYDLMNGVVFFNGTRYEISELDLAMARDGGLAVVPEPKMWLLLAAGAFFLAANLRSIRRQADFESRAAFSIPPAD